MVTPLNSLEGIELISGAAAAISKLPENLSDFPKDLLIETLNYKELNFTFWGIFTLYKIPFFV